jgi:hypothetical protein
VQSSTRSFGNSAQRHDDPLEKPSGAFRYWSAGVLIWFLADFYEFGLSNRYDSQS